jgi:hypothetical protein
MRRERMATAMKALSSLKKTIVYPIFGALLLALAAWGQPGLALAGAGSGLSAAPGGVLVSQGSEIGGYAELIAALQAAGATVTPGQDINQSFIPVKGHLLTVNGADVQVFEFQDEPSRQQVSDSISQAQNSITTSLPSGIDWPNFWAKGRLIVLYIGQDQATINTLSKVLGNPLTQAPPAAKPPSPVTLAAQQRLAKALGVSAAQVQLASAEQVQWPNTCLGMTSPGTACADEVTPGWRMTFDVNGQQYEMHTNASASVVRWQRQVGPDISIGGLKSQATSAEKQIEKDVQQAGLKAEFTKLQKELEKDMGGLNPTITQAWNGLQSQAAIAWRDLTRAVNREISQLSKSVQAAGASQK